VDWTKLLPNPTLVAEEVRSGTGVPIQLFRNPGEPVSVARVSRALGTSMSAESNVDDIRCMERLAQGDHAALEELYARWSRPLLHFLYRMCLDRSLAEDLLQGVFVRVWRASPSYQPLAKFSTWLFQIARNHWLNEREKKLRRIRPVSLDSTGRGSDASDGQGLAAAVDSGAPAPDVIAERSELGRQIAEAGARLPDKLREVWTLGAVQGLPYREVSDVLGIPVGTVKSRMFQAVRLLREDLEAVGACPSGPAEPD
jgi:RNA polymerase sigma-70 factor (ECF subfamily)